MREIRITVPSLYATACRYNLAIDFRAIINIRLGNEVRIVFVPKKYSYLSYPEIFEVSYDTGDGEYCSVLVGIKEFMDIEMSVVRTFLEEMGYDISKITLAVDLSELKK